VSPSVNHSSLPGAHFPEWRGDFLPFFNRIVSLRCGLVVTHVGLSPISLLAWLWRLNRCLRSAGSVLCAKIAVGIGPTPAESRATLPHYITLFRFTQKGVEDIKGGPARLDAAKKGIEAAGGKIKGFYTEEEYRKLIVSWPEVEDSCEK